jgi:hypothetical protein
MSDTLGDKHDKEMAAYTRNDMVRHTLGMAISTLRPEDKLGIVAFSNDARRLLELTSMDAAGKQRAMEAMGRIGTSGGTNLWGGLSESMDMMNSTTYMNHNAGGVILLTDGEPNVNPPAGILPEYVKKLSAMNFQTPIHTFGYGYSLDSKLLATISKLTGGGFGHIPDYTMCNTIFINRMSNSFASIANTVRLIGVRGRAVELISHPMPAESDASRGVYLGSLQSGQPKNIVLQVEKEDMSREDLEFIIDIDGKQFPYMISIDPSTAEDTNTVEALRTVRAATSNMLNRVVCDDNPQPIASIHALLMKSVRVLDNILSVARDARLRDEATALRDNIVSNNTNDGQLAKAFSNPEWWGRWGPHYVQSWVSGERGHISPNFKDKGLQHYGSKLFRDLRREIEDILSSTPAPTPSTGQTYSGNYHQTTYNPSGPCVDGDGLVLMNDGKRKLVRDLSKGDVVAGGAKIICVIKTVIHGGKCHMFRFDGMLVTPFHPIRLPFTGRWQFPAKMGDSLGSEVDIDFIYNFVLDRWHILNINGVEVITMGHSYTEGILKHPFFGSKKVIEALERRLGYADGIVIINKYEPKYDSDGMICDF